MFLLGHYLAGLIEGDGSIIVPVTNPRGFTSFPSERRLTGIKKVNDDFFFRRCSQGYAGKSAYGLELVGTVSAVVGAEPVEIPELLLLLTTGARKEKSSD